MHLHHRLAHRSLAPLAAVVLATLLCCFPSAAFAAEGALQAGMPATISDDSASGADTDTPATLAGNDEATVPAEGAPAEEPAPTEVQAESLSVSPIDATQEPESDAAADADEAMPPSQEQGEAAAPAADEALAAQESAATGVNGSYLIETGSSETVVLEAERPSEGAAVKPVTYSSKSPNQVWDISYDAAADAHRILLSSSNGKLALATDDTARLFLASVETTDPKVSLLWALFAAGGDGYQIASIGYPTLCISSSQSSSRLAAKADAACAPVAQCHYLVDTHPSVKAGTDNVEDAYHITATDSSKVVEVRGASTANGAEVEVYKLNGKNHQKVYLERDAQGFYTAWIVGSGKVIDVRGSALIPGTSIIQWANRSTDNQKWAVCSNGDGTYSLINKATGLALGTRGNKLVGVRATSSERASFELNVTALVTGGIYAITPRTTSSVCIDVSRSSTKDGAKLALYTQHGTLNQRYHLLSAGTTNLWRIRTGSSGGWITYSGGSVIQQGSSSTAVSGANSWKMTFKGGWFCLVNKASGKALDMRGGSTKSGTSIIAYAPNGRDSQHFNFVASELVKEGTYQITSYYGVRLDVQGASTKAGANIQTWSPHNAANQRFKLKKSGKGYLLINDKSGMAVTSCDLYRPGGNIAQHPVSGKSNQLWNPQIADGGYLCFTNVGTGKVLALDEPGTDKYSNGVSVSKAGRNAIQLSKSGGNNTQRWRVKAVSSIGNATTKTASKRILLIGNSFTFCNDLASKLTSKVSGAAAVSCTRGSALLSNHVSTTDALGKKTRAAILEGGWDYVVIQEMSTQCIDDYNDYLTNLKAIASLVKSVGATPIIYGTWAFSGGSGSQGYGSSVRGISNATMNSRLQSAFSKASKATGIKYVNTGKEFATKTSAHDAFDDKLYDNDMKHPSSYGTDLIAGIIAKALV